ELGQKLEDACPVAIFAAREGGVQVVEENLDECVLCELCVKAAPPGTLRGRKLYDGTALEACHEPLGGGAPAGGPPGRRGDRRVGLRERRLGWGRGAWRWRR